MTVHRFQQKQVVRIKHALSNLIFEKRNAEGIFFVNYVTPSQYSVVMSLT